MNRSLIKIFSALVLATVVLSGISGCGEKYPSDPINKQRGEGTADDEDNYEDAEPEYGDN